MSGSVLSGSSNSPPDLALIDRGELLAEQWPALPQQLSDRQADLWEPLFAVADYAGNVWPSRARDEATQLHTGGDQAGETIGVQLLADCRTVFAEEPALWTEALLKGLHALDEAPWGDWYGKPITPWFLAKGLRPYGIRSQNVRLPAGQKKGYTRVALARAWERYLPEATTYGASQASQPSQPLRDKGSRTESSASRTRPAPIPGDRGTAPGLIGTVPESGGTSTATSDGTEGTAATAALPPAASGSDLDPSAASLPGGATA